MFFIHIMPYFFISISFIAWSTFIVIFICIPWRYYWIFHSLFLGLSLWISFLFPGDIIGYFIVYPWHFHCDFHSYSLAILLDISLVISGVFIAIFIYIPRQYYWIFHCLSLVFSLRFHNYPCAILSLYPSLGLGLKFSFCCQAYFITA